jgi:hypothetical protein
MPHHAITKEEENQITYSEKRQKKKLISRESLAFVTFFLLMFLILLKMLTTLPLNQRESSTLN